MKKSFLYPTLIPSLTATRAAIILCSVPLAVTATDIHWDSNGATAGAGTTPTGNWGTSAFWSTDATGASAAVSAWNTADTAVFSAGSDATTTYTVTVNANTAAAGLRFEEGSPTFVSATNAKNLTVNSNLDLTLGSRSVIVGTSTSTTNVNLLLGTNTLTLNSGNLDLYGSNTMASALLKGGVVILGNANALGTSGTVTFGDTAANSSPQMRLRSITLNRPIALQSGTGFTLNATINNVGFASPTLTGGITSTGTGTTNLTIDSVISGSGSALTLTFSGTNAINHTGALTLRNTGTGTGSPTGTLAVSAPIGANVTTVTVSDTSGGVKGLQKVTLGSTSNAWTGNTTVNSPARLELTANEVIPHGTGKGNVTVDGTLDVRGNETINGLSGGGLVTRSTSGTSALTVGGNNASSSFSGTIENGSGTLSLTKTGTGTLTFTGTNTYSGGTTLGNDAGKIAISNGGALGTGTVALTKIGTSGAMLDISGDITVPNNFTFSSAVGYAPTGGGSAHIRNVSGNNNLSGTLTLTATGGNGINLESAAGLLTVSGGITSTVPDDARDINVGGDGDGLITGTITESTGNFLSLLKSGTGTWTIEGASSYSEETIIRAGTLAFKAPYLNDFARVEIANGATLKLDFVGTDVIGELTLNGIVQAAGTWGAPGSGAEHTSDRISGTGLLLVDPVEFTWTDGAADGKWSTVGNWDVMAAPDVDSVITFGASTSTTLQNNLPALTSLESLSFLAAAPSYLIDGNAITLTGGIANASSSSQNLGFDITLGNDVTVLNSGGLLTLDGNIDGAHGITKTGAGELILSGTNTYTGTTSIADGGITSASATSLPSGAIIAFKNTTGAAFLDISGLDQTLAGLTFGTQTSAGGIVTLFGNNTASLTVSPASLTFAPAVSPIASALTVTMASLDQFTYNNPAGTFALQPGISTGTGVTTVTLAGGTNSITAANLNLAGLNAASGNRSILNLGLENTIHANNLSLAAGSGRASAILQFASGLPAGGTLQIRNAAGTGAASVTAGKNSSFGGDGTVYTSVIDTTGNQATLDALVSTLLVGNAQCDSTGAGRQVNSNGTFRMGAGTLNATLAEIGVLGGVTPTASNNFTATGLLDLTGPGTANIGTVTLAKNALPSVIGTTNINGQVTIAGGARLNAATIQQGAAVSGETSRIARVNFNNGTIGHLPDQDLTISGVALVLGSEGSHAFDVASERTATVSSIVSGSGSALTKTGAGTLILSGLNTYTANTVVSAGTLSVTHANSFDDTTSVTVAPGATLHLNFAGSDTVAAITLGETNLGPGTYTSSHPSGRITGTGTLVIPGGDPFTPWINSFTFAPGADKTKSGDPDGDGVSNEMEFALDGDPSSGVATGKVVGKVDSGHLTITLPVRTGVTFNGSGPLISIAADGVIYRIEGDDDFAGFTAGVEEVPALTDNMPNLTTGWTYRTFRLTALTSAAPKGFLRADVSSSTP